MTSDTCVSLASWGINHLFGWLSPCTGQVAYALLTRPPLSIMKIYRSFISLFLARLACVRHAASVHPEPGSNSQLVCILSFRFNIYPISLRTLLRLQYSIQNHCFFEKLSLCLNFLRLHTIFSDCRTIISSYHVTWSNFI